MQEKIQMQIWYRPFCPLYISSQYWRTIN